MIVMVIITILITIGIDKSTICLLCCFASYSALLMEGWNNFGPTGLDTNKGSTQLYVEISNKRSKVDFEVENIYFCCQYF